MKWSNIKELLMHILFFLTACVSIFAVVLICVFLFANGIPAIGKIGVFKFLLGTKWKPGNDIYGILPMILGSLYVTAGGVPSVVYGFFGLVVLVPLVQNIFGVAGNTMLTASVLLGIMILPTIIGVSESAIRAVPDSYYEGSLALGASHERSVFFATLPAARSGILAGVVLGIGRAIGETMAVVMVAGNKPRMPQGLLDGVRTMTANIVMEMGYATDLHREALIATAVVLFVFILMINVTFSLLRRKDRA